MNSDREGRAPGEPPNGDFVAYLEDIERRQLADMNRPHALAHPSPQGGAQVAAAKPLSRDEARALIGRLRARRGALPLSAGSLLMLIVGALALANALFGDGGILALAIGVALLWRPVRRLIGAFRTAAATSPGPRDALDAAFGKSKSHR
ncbi:MAG: hypothetical protein BroJett031_13510 [Betaproteobacteria bacterium]|nr:MAG: hypothetical protein BroJett031_13510 [Betaproteobacteria bacterium]